MQQIIAIFQPVFFRLCFLGACCVTSVLSTQAQQSLADSNQVAIVQQILVTGNKKTTTRVILREIQFKPGDTLALVGLTKQLQLARQQIYNTTLFTEVQVDTSLQQQQLTVSVKVKERWYIYPLPQFQPVDRNLNEWLVKYKGDLSRVNYGIKFVHFNLSGERDILRLYLMNGYTRNIAFSYTRPYSTSALTEGFIFGAGYSQSREVAFATSNDNKLQFYKTGNFVRKNIVANAGYSYRKGILGRHLFLLSLNYTAVNDSVINPLYNPAYFNNGKAHALYPDITYQYRFTNVNNVAYPLKGQTALITVVKRGLGWKNGINMLSVEGNASVYKSLGHQWYAAVQVTGKVKLPFEQSYFNQKAIGYGDNTVRGLEYYVIDGVAFGITKATIRKKLLAFSIPFPIKNKYINRIPFAFYAKAFTDAGYAYSKPGYTTPLNNKFLYSGGFGLDIISIYDFNLRIEYSFNQLGQRGVFLQTQGGF